LKFNPDLLTEFIENFAKIRIFLIRRSFSKTAAGESCSHRLWSLRM